jgi:serine/threonine protein kinase/Flp pilus assembly protein TadD
MSGCPTELELRRFAAHRLSGRERAALETHMRGCADCTTRVAELSAVSSSDETVASDPKLLAARSIPPVDGGRGGTFDASGNDPSNETLVAPASVPVPAERGRPGAAGHGPPAGAPAVEGYRILREVARGGMGVIFEAMQLKLNRRVALKVLPSIGSGADEQAISRFRREATAAAKLHHTHIVPIYDFGQSGHTYYYAMELVEGWTLTEMIKRFAAGNAPAADNTRLAAIIRGADLGAATEPASSASIDTALTSASFTQTTVSRGRAYYRHVAHWMANAADALHYAHSQDIIHRDIKPGNLMLCTDGRVMILDFGLAKSTSDLSVTTTGALVGTLRYMSPEQAMAKRMKVDHRTDIYSLGATMYELLTFQPAFRGADEKETLGLIITRDPTPPRKIIPEVPKELETICLKAMEKDPNARYLTSKELADDLRRYAQDLPIHARPPGPIGRAIKFARRRRAVTVTICSLVLLMLAGLLTMQAFRQKRQSDRAAKALRIEGLLREGSDNWNKKDWEKADAAFANVLALDPNNCAALINLANIKRLRYPDLAPASVLDECNSLLDRALKLEPNQVKTWNSKGVVLRSRGKIDEAIAAHRKGNEYDANYYPNWVSLASAYVVKGDLAEAETCLQTACAMKEAATNTMPWHNLAAVQHQLGKPEALASMEKALTIKSAEPMVMLLKARILIDRADKADLKQGLRAAITAEGLDTGPAKNPRIARVLAIAELRNEHWDEALEAAQRALQLKDQPAWPRLIIAHIEARRGRKGEAQGHLDAARVGQPAEFASQEIFVRVEQGFLWFESAAELERLRDEAERQMARGG